MSGNEKWAFMGEFINSFQTCTFYRVHGPMALNLPVHKQFIQCINIVFLDNICDLELIIQIGKFLLLSCALFLIMDYGKLVKLGILVVFSSLMTTAANRSPAYRVE